MISTRRNVSWIFESSLGEKSRELIEWKGIDSREFTRQVEAPVVPERQSLEASINTGDTLSVASQDVEMEVEKKKVEVPLVVAPVPKVVVPNAVASGSGSGSFAAEALAAGERKKKRARKELEERDNWGFVLVSSTIVGISD